MTDSSRQDPTAELGQIREQIDALDRQILTLVSQRAGFAQRVAQVKAAMGEAEQCYRPEREAQVLRQVIKCNPGPVSDSDIARLFREIMSICLALETPLRVAFPDLPGGVGLSALRKQFGVGVEARVMPGTTAVFETVTRGECHYGMVPVEVANGSGVVHTLEHFLDSSLLICGEVRTGAQQSRFLVIGRVPVRPSGRDLSSILLGIPDHPGSLHQVLAIPAQHQVNIQHIESRPAPGNGQEVFFLDLQGHCEEPEVARVLEELSRVSSFMKFLGSYPVSVL